MFPFDFFKCSGIASEWKKCIISSWSNGSSAAPARSVYDFGGPQKSTTGRDAEVAEAGPMPAPAAG